ncbi:MAG: TIGR00725 family protein [Archaeoglobaceae archaeon]
MKQIGIVGASSCDEKTYENAFQAGRILAQKKCTVINGGLGGVMEASAKGAHTEGGIVVGILPGEKQLANPYIGVSIATNMGHARNMIIAHSSDAVIAIGGSYGTVSEVSIALKEGKRVVAIDPPLTFPDFIVCNSAQEAVEKALEE